jgi:signal peptidase I
LTAQENRTAPYIGKAGISLSNRDIAGLIRPVLEKGALFRFKARGFSMSPFIKDGDVITLSPLSFSPPRLGDVVAFIHPHTSHLLVHRVIGKRADAFIIKGDNHATGEDHVPPVNILGRVTKLKRGTRTVRLGLGPDRLLIALLSRSRFFFVLLSVLRRLVRHVRRGG